MGLCDLPCDLLAATLQFADHSTLLQLESVCRHVQDVMVQFDDGKLGTLVYESMEYNVVKDMEVPVYSNEERLAFRLSEHDAGIAALAFSDDERLLCSVGSPEDGPRLYIWDVMTGNICATHQKISNIVTAVAFGGMARDVKRRDTANYQFATVGHRLLVIWVLNPVTGELTQSKIEQMLVRDYTCVQFSPDFETLVAGSSSGDFSVVGVKTRQLFKVVPACSCGVNSILYFDGALSSDQRLVLSAGQEKRISYWDLRIDTPVTVIQKAHEEEATCIAVAHNLDVFATGGNDRLHSVQTTGNSSLSVTTVVFSSGMSTRISEVSDDRNLMDN
ncbi:hypothetical protein BBO99_00001297 [Phytophthora kernoviae]|uniref:F-box domain-containing protein n=1 Tax=Phytophthora kernoviae TaxID=325452 RepID=A0A3R7J9P0_9STRA|nr:hypothetical protein BBI17_001092 [Phytophthora kernoviae]RLN84485.1 hypothetical protein BBO99_00001297 [Phytophthora kernoviae]